MQVQEIIEKAKTRVESLRKEAETRVEKVRGEAKSRFELVSGRAENAIKVSTDTLKKAGDLVSTTAKTVAKTNQDAAEDLYGQAKTSVTKAREAGFKAVSEKPADFLPQGRTVVVKAFEEVFQANWLRAEQSRNYQELLSPDSSPAICCRNANILHSLTFIPSYKILGSNVSICNQLWNCIYNTSKF